MNRVFYITSLIFLLNIQLGFTQTIDGLRQKIQDIIATKKAKLGVAIMGANEKDTLSINGQAHLPMQSVFKLHIALAVLSEVDKGKWRLNQKITIEKKDLYPDLYSPIREKYPQGAILKLSEILEYTVGASDNVGCELLLKMLGGPQVVEQYFLDKGFKDISIKINEQVMQGNWDRQYENWTTPEAANAVLKAFYENKPQLLSKKSYNFLWKTMKATQTGQKRLKGQLPKGTIVAHKTGTSGTNKAGLSAATNDMGIVFLPNGQPIYISVFVSDSTENSDTNEKIIAEIGKATWDFFIQKGE